MVVSEEVECGCCCCCCFFFQAEDGIRDYDVTGVQTCALPILPKKLSELDFVYDSSNKKTKDSITHEDMGYQRIDGIIEFPITLMDAYLFTYMKISEDKIVSIVEKTLNSCRKLDSDFNVMTILWHDNVLKMKGGRMYEKILEFLSNQEDVKMVSGIELANKVLKNL